MRGPVKLREKDVQLAVRRVYEAVGCIVYRIATTQTGPTLVSPGVPDLIVFHHKGGVWFHEVKTPEGRLRPEQRSFREVCDQCRVRYVYGGVQEAYNVLWARGVLAGGKTLAEEVAEKEGGDAA